MSTPPIRPNPSPVSPEPSSPRVVPPASQSTSKSGGFRKAMLGMVAALAIAGGAYFYQSSGLPNDDTLPAKQQQEIEAAFATAVADFPSVNLASPVERAKAKASLDLPEAQAEELVKRAESGQFRLAWVTVWDFCAEDGDTVQLTSNGYSHTVRLAHKPVTCVMPVTGAGNVAVKGIYDGGGGITVGMKTNGGDVLCPVMRPGQTITLRLK